MKLTKNAVATLTLPRRKSELLVFDSDLPGFGVRLREGGSKTWIFQYKLGNKHRRITLGRVAALEPAAAREQASKLHAQVRLGQDPAGTRAESRARADETFGACVQLFLAWQRNRVKSFRDVERHLVKNLAALHNMPLVKIDQRTIAAQLARMSASSPIQANRTRANLSKFFNWCCAEGLTESNPAAFCNRNPERSRDRVLTPGELKQIWAALPDSDYGDIVRLLILTGQRATEISDLQWSSEIDLERGLISLPPSRTKNRRRHVVPMSDMVREILEARPQNGREFVFGVGQERGFSGWSRAKSALDEAVQIPSWRVHDIRRSVATHMNEIGIPPWIVESVLNHVSGLKAGIAGVYNRASHQAEKANALTRWAEHVADIIEGRKTNVRPLQGAS